MTGLIPSATSQGSMAALPVTIDYPTALALRPVSYTHLDVYKRQVSGIVLAGQLNNLMPVTGLLTGNIELPVATEPLQVIFVVLATILISLLSTLYPAWKAASIPPAEALRYS